jgi:hypothetical protein
VLSEEQRTSWIIGATFAALLALSAALLAAFSHSIHVADAFIRKEEQVMVSRYLEGRMRGLIVAQTGLLIWDETMRRAVLGRDLAWMDRELGSFPGPTSARRNRCWSMLTESWSGPGVSAGSHRTIIMARCAGRSRRFWRRRVAITV